MNISIIPISVINKEMAESKTKSNETFAEVLKREEHKLWQKERKNNKMNMMRW